MSLLAPLLRADTGAPRLTVYDETRGYRMDFSAQTLDNWANKVANMLDEEFDSAERPLIDLPVSWQSAVIALGAINSSRTPLFDDNLSPDVVFTTLEGSQRWQDIPDCVIVSKDPFGRGIVEAGGDLPAGTIDFGPTVRFYGDAYFGESPELSRFSAGLAPKRYLVQEFNGLDGVVDKLLAPIAAGGSVVLVAGLVSADRLQEIADAEKVDAILDDARG